MIKKSIVHIFSFEAAFICFLNAGMVKGDPRFDFIPIDITLLFMALSVAMAFVIIARRGFKFGAFSLRSLGWYLSFLTYALCSYLWSPGIDYAEEKVFLMSTVLSWAVLGASLVIVQERTRLLRFLYLNIVFSLWVTYEAWVVFLKQTNTGSLFVLGGNYIMLGRILGLGGLVLMGYLFTAKMSIWFRGLQGAALFALIFILIVGGARGPLIAFVFSLGILFYFSYLYTQQALIFRPYFSALILIFLISVIGIIIFVQTSDRLPQTFLRMLLFLEGQDASSAGVRASYYLPSLSEWAGNPIFGHGIGSWPIENGKGDYRDYPHSIVLEILVELGLIGLILFFGFISSGLKFVFSTPKRNYSTAGICYCMVWVFMFANTLVSADLPDNRLFFTITALLPGFFHFGGDKLWA